MDESNFGVIQCEEYYQVVKIDPEACFGDDFIYGNEDEINKIQKIYKQLNSYIFQKCKSEALEDKFAILARIISLPLKAYFKIIDSSLSSVFKEQKQIYKELIEKRRTFFRDAAFKLKGFPSYYENYIKHLNMKDILKIQIEQSIPHLGTKPQILNNFSLWKTMRKPDATIEMIKIETGLAHIS